MIEGFPRESLLSRFERLAPVPPEPIFCGGLSDERINQFGESDATRGYLNSTFCHFKGQR